MYFSKMGISYYVHKVIVNIPNDVKLVYFVLQWINTFWAAEFFEEMTWIYERNPRI